MKQIVQMSVLWLVAGCGGVDAGPTPSVIVSVEPLRVTLSWGSATRFRATVTGATDASVTWSADSGVIDSDGMYVAPASSGTFQVTARSHADPTRAATVIVSVLSPVSVSIERPTLSLPAGVMLSVQLTAMVTGTADTRVAWSVQEGAAGGAVDASGRYTSRGDPGTFHVVATSQADPTRFAVATIIVLYADDLIDHGGPVLPATRTFLLFWGDAAAFPSDARARLEDLFGGLQGSSYLAVVDQYLRGSSARTVWGGTFFDPSAPPNDAIDAVIADAACRALAANGIEARSGDFVAVTTSNFPASFDACGWHSFTTCNGASVVFAYVPNPAGSRCGTAPDPCKTGDSSTTLSLLLAASHELVESITDPFGTAWRTSGGKEAMDVCGEIACVNLSTGVLPLPTIQSNATHSCVSR